MWLLATGLLLLLLQTTEGQMSDEEFDLSWYNTEELPQVDLEGLIRNLTKQITWFKYVGRRTLRCARLARRQDTLMLAIERLHDCLEDAYQECASEFANQTGCDRIPGSGNHSQPCGHMRLGYQGNFPVYENNLECQWYLQVPYDGLFVMNLTIDELYMESSGLDCVYDHMMIYDGHHEEARSWGRFCGRIPRFTVYGSTNQMMIKAVTDSSIGKYGFRAVYQVMDIGHGYNYEEPPIFKEPQGTFSLATSAPTIFEIYWNAFYYTKWLIRADFGQVIQIDLEFIADLGATVFVFNGPSFENEILLKLNFSELDTEGQPLNMIGIAQRNTTETTSFNALIMVQRKSLNDTTQLNAQWFTRSLSPEELVHSGQCYNGSETMLDGPELFSIGVGTDAVLDAGRPIQCFWNFKTTPGNFIQLDIKKLTLNASDYDRCMYEGLLVMNGPTLDDGVQRIGPFCYDEPLGIFTSRGVKQITSSGQNLLIMFYSFLKYPSMTAGDTKRGVFQAVVSKTLCQGLLQVCDTPPGQIQTPNYRFLSLNMNASVDITIFCEKSKCCRMQQFPTYTSTAYDTCNVSIKTEGKQLLATSEFRTDLVAPDKWNQQIQYACQRQERLRSQEANKTGKFDGAYSYRCLGTEVHLAYSSSSIWSMPAFTVQVMKNKCGYYRPDRHIANEFYPPCAVAQFPVKKGNFPVKYVDPSYKQGRYFNFLVQYRDKDYSLHESKCPRECAYSDLLHIVGQYDSYAWSTLPELPFRWRSWGRSSIDTAGNWTRELVIERRQGVYSHCTNVPGCEINVEFFGSTMDKTLVEGIGNITCPEGFSHVGTGCYLIGWPDDITEADLLNDTVQMSWDEAQDFCRQRGSDLISINTEEEIAALKVKIYYDWWQQYLQRVPGLKIIHIGLRWSPKTNDDRWIYNEPITYSDWAVPDYKNTRPDRTSFPGGELIDSVRSEALKNSLNFLQPWNVKDYHCTVIVISSFHEPFSWVRVPCNETIPGSLPLCELHVSEPVTPSDTIASTPYNYQTTVMSTASTNTLQLSDYECPTPFSLVGTKCLVLYYHGTYVSEEEHRKGCRKVKKTSTPALFNHYLLSLMNETLPYWKQDLKTGNIRITFDSPEAGTDSSCYALVMTPVSDGPNGTNVRPTWMLSHLTPCYVSDPQETTLLPLHDKLTSSICEVDPVNVTETCGQDHYVCPDGTCVLAHHKCDGHDDCYGGADEENCEHVCTWNKLAVPGSCFTSCSSDNCTCHPLYFQCHTGGCIPGSKICDFLSDCSDGSDELICNHLSCGDREFRCNDGMCIAMGRKCDFRRDCLDGSDEDPEVCKLNEKCPSRGSGYFRCSTGKCIPEEQKNDLVPDCFEDMMKDEDQGYLDVYRNAKVDRVDGSLILPIQRCSGSDLNCNLYYKDKCYAMHEACVYDHDKFGNMAFCRTGSHLQNCEARSCGSMFKCTNSYCIPTRKLCDGVSDCPRGEDEQKCKNFQCPGMFRCKKEKFCIKQSQVCDGILDCKDSHDDEALCNYRLIGCPTNCECFGKTTSCAKRKLTEFPKIQINEDSKKVILKGVRILLLNNNQLSQELPESLKALSQLYRLDLSNNEISNLGENTFERMAMLIELYFHNNKIVGLNSKNFNGLTNLRVLTLYGNNIGHITRDALKGLDSLPVFDVSGQELRTLDDFVFAGLLGIRSLNLSYNWIDSITNKTFAALEGDGKLETLSYLNIKGNPLVKAEPFAFRYLPDHAFLESDRFKYCCFARHIERCMPGPDEFSSCDNLISNPGLRVAIWAIGLPAFLGNLVILQQRMKHEKDTGTSLLVQHLSFADLLMGVYVLIIAGADQYYKGNYIYAADDWRKHALCKLGGFLSMLACEMSSFCIMLISVDRLYGCVPGCGKGKGMGVRGARGFIALGWTACTVLSIIPILEFGYFGSGSYVRGGVCTLYNVIKGRRMSGWEFSMAIFVIANFLLHTASAVAYLCVYRGMLKGIDAWEFPEEMTEEEKETERQFRRNEFLLGRRLVLLVGTNFVVWMPLIVVGAMALAGYDVDQTTSAWIAMFVMPLNSALNPFMYSFTTKPYRIPRDDLLANWRGEEVGEDEEEDGDRGETTMGETSVAGTNVTTSRDSKAIAREAVLREML